MKRIVIILILCYANLNTFSQINDSIDWSDWNEVFKLEKKLEEEGLLTDSIKIVFFDKFAQKRKEIDDSIRYPYRYAQKITDLLNDAFITYIAYLGSNEQYHDSKELYDTAIYVSLDYLPMAFIANNELASKSKLIYLNNSSERKRLGTKKEVRMLFLEDVIFINNKMICKISLRYVKRERKNIVHIAMFIWTYVIYEYSFDDSKWKFKEVKYEDI